MILIACRYLLDQEGGSNETFVTIYSCLALLSLYSLYCQWDKYRREGCGDDDDDVGADSEGLEAEVSERSGSRALQAPQIEDKRQQRSTGKFNSAAPISTTSAVPVRHSGASLGTGSVAAPAAANHVHASSSKRRRA